MKNVLIENGDGLPTSAGDVIALSTGDLTTQSNYNASTMIVKTVGFEDVINVKFQEGSTTMTHWDGASFIEVAQPPVPNDLEVVYKGELKTAFTAFTNGFHIIQTDANGDLTAVQFYTQREMQSAPITNSSTTPIDVLTLTTPADLEDGDYRLTFYFKFNFNDTGEKQIFKFYVDAVETGEAICIEPEDDDNVYSQQSISFVNFAAGSGQSIDIKFTMENEGGINTAEVFDAFIELKTDV